MPAELCNTEYPIPEKFNNIIDHYLFTGRTPMMNEVPGMIKGDNQGVPESFDLTCRVIRDHKTIEV